MKKRDTGPELLRIIAMLFIMFHHFAEHSGIDFSVWSINNITLALMQSLGKIGVNVFVLITGYYSCNSKFSVKKL